MLKKTPNKEGPYPLLQLPGALLAWYFTDRRNITRDQQPKPRLYLDKDGSRGFADSS